MEASLMWRGMKNSHEKLSSDDERKVIFLL